jgi:excisionase family DNA binding protein
MIGALLTAREVAGHLGVAPKTVLAWTRRGQLPAIRLPSGQLRYPADELNDWLEQRATPRRGESPTPHDAARRGLTLASLRSPTPEDEE